MLRTVLKNLKSPSQKTIKYSTEKYWRLTENRVEAIKRRYEKKQSFYLGEKIKRIDNISAGLCNSFIEDSL